MTVEGAHGLNPITRLELTEGLVRSVRDLMAASTTSDVDADALLAARGLVERATELLAARTRGHGLRVHFDREHIARTRAGEPWQVFRHNPLGIPLSVYVTGDSARATVVPSALLEGPPGLLHGGFSAHLMDALLSTLVQAQGLRAVTVRLQVELLSPVPLDEPLELSGVVSAVHGRKITARGVIQRLGAEVVRAEALLITIPGEPD